jgi:hypothetical protein
MTGATSPLRTVGELAQALCERLSHEHREELSRRCRCGCLWAIHTAASPHACTECIDCRSFTCAEPLLENLI